MAELKPWEKRAAAKAAGQTPWEKRAKEAPPAEEASWWDTLNGLGAAAVTGINRGAVGALGLPKAAADLTATGLDWAGVIEPESAQYVYDTLPGATPENLIKSWEGFAGELPKPRNAAEQTVSDVAEFIPALGVGGAGRKAISEVAKATGKSATKQIAKANLKRVGVGASAGLGSSVAGQALEGTNLETPARIAGALVGGATGSKLAGKEGFRQVGSAIGNPDKAAPKVRAQADQMYDALRGEDAVYDINSFKRFIRDVPNKSQLRNVYEPTSPITGRKLKDMGKKRPTASKLEDVRSDLGEFGFTGAPDVDKNRAKALRGALSDFMDTAPMKTKNMTPDAYRGLRGDAREMAQRSILYDTLDKIGRNAEGYDIGTDRAIRGQVRSYYRKNLDNLEPAMKDALEDISKREGLISTPLVNLSSRLGGIAMGAGGIATGGLLPLLASVPVHVAARGAADMLAKSQLKGAKQLALVGRKGRKAALKANKEAAKRRLADILLALGRATQDR